MRRWLELLTEVANEHGGARATRSSSETTR
jgi:hypothetical protein